MNIIAGDIGGTKSWLAWAVVRHGAEVETRFEKIYASADFATPEALLQQFLDDAGQEQPLDVACLALPGPVTAGQPVKLTNLDWIMQQEPLKALLNASALFFINDFQAAAEGVATLTADDYQALNAVAATPGATRVITGPGTGLGLAWMQADAAGRYHPFPTEGGHTDFAPANARQERLLAFMRERFAHVSWERVLSGPGVSDVYRFCLQDMTGDIPAALGERNGAVINEAAQQGDTVARAAMELFTELFGNWVGNIALLYQPRGGLYLGGGIAARIQPWLQTPRFLDACFDKGRMTGLVQQTPVNLITNTRLGLQGALAAATHYRN